MKKLFSLFVVCVATMAVMATEPIILTPEGQETHKPESNAGDLISVTIDGITLVWTGALYNEENNQDFRIYGGKSMTISAENAISKVVIAGKANKAGLVTTVDAGEVTTGASYDEVTTKATLEEPLIVVENINAQFVTLTVAKQVRCYQIAVYTQGTSNLDNVQVESNKATKIIENGQVYILRDGVKYNIFGAQVD